MGLKADSHTRSVWSLSLSHIVPFAHVKPWFFQHWHLSGFLASPDSAPLSLTSQAMAKTHVSPQCFYCMLSLFLSSKQHVIPFSFPLGAILDSNKHCFISLAYNETRVLLSSQHPCCISHLGPHRESQIQLQKAPHIKKKKIFLYYALHLTFPEEQQTSTLVALSFYCTVETWWCSEMQRTFSWACLL